MPLRIKQVQEIYLKNLIFVGALKAAYFGVRSSLLGLP
jgi:hypothetical protein